MIFEKWKDHWLTGSLLGLFQLPFCYVVLVWLRSILAEFLSRPGFMSSPVLELLTILSGILTARYLLVNRALEQTGKGLMLVVLLTALGYFYFSFRIRHAY